MAYGCVIGFGTFAEDDEFVIRARIYREIAFYFDVLLEP